VTGEVWIDLEQTVINAAINNGESVSLMFVGQHCKPFRRQL